MRSYYLQGVINVKRELEQRRYLRGSDGELEQLSVERQQQHWRAARL